MEGAMAADSYGGNVLTNRIIQTLSTGILKLRSLFHPLLRSDRCSARKGRLGAVPASS
jgi:hypothetical protein